MERKVRYWPVRAALAAGLLALAAAGILGLSGCGLVVRRVETPVRRDSRQTDLQGAKSMRAEVRMGLGELRVEGGAAGAMDADFEYSRRDWRPNVDYAVNGGVGVLEVRQPDVRTFGFGGHRNTWSIRLNDGVPLDLEVETGAGRTTLELGRLDLRSLDVRTGAGETTLDLSGADHDARVRVQTGAGELDLLVPDDVGVRVNVRSVGVGDIRADGFRREGDAFVNDAWDDAEARLEIDLDHGVGDVEVLSR